MLDFQESLLKKNNWQNFYVKKLDGIKLTIFFVFSVLRPTQNVWPKNIIWRRADQRVRHLRRCSGRQPVWSDDLGLRTASAAAAATTVGFRRERVRKSGTTTADRRRTLRNAVGGNGGRIVRSATGNVNPCLWRIWSYGSWHIHVSLKSLIFLIKQESIRNLVFSSSQFLIWSFYKNKSPKTSPLLVLWALSNNVKPKTKT
jgi:hypothetical protein